jgi:NTE family protein
MARIGLVLGAGGQVGHAFHAGVLAALSDTFGWDPNQAELIVGTSAGSGVAALLRAGMPATDIAARALGEPVSAAALELAARLGPPATLPPRRLAAPGRRWVASPELLVRLALRPWEARFGTLAAAALPEGWVSTDLVSAGPQRAFGRNWPERSLWICAVSLDRGRRVVFGRPESPAATVGEAVAASCAIPGFFTPVTIDGVRYVDGGAHSPTNADLVSGLGLDLVLVSSPMSAQRLSVSPDGALRALCRLRLAEEATRVRRAGTPVVVFAPTPQDLAVMGWSASAMDGRRRAAVTRQARASLRARLLDSVFGKRLEPLVA